MINYYPNAQNPLWIDMDKPTPEDEMAVEMHLGIDIPTREEMAEIELSNRLYTENNAVYTTLVVVAKADSKMPQTEILSFILTPKCLVTLRYVELQAFSHFRIRLEKNGVNDAAQIYTGLVEAIINRSADILEKIGHNIDVLSRKIFREGKQSKNFRSILRGLGANGDLISKCRESLISMSRALGYVWAGSVGDSVRTQLETLTKDVTALGNHADSLSNKITFMLDAVLGLIGFEQNNIIKLFTVAALIFLPPTLIAGIFGMNFHNMPELDWHYGYLYSIVLMVVSAVLPLAYFRKKNWI